MTIHINEASMYIYRRCRQFARMGVHIRVKHGTLQISTTCAYFTEYTFIHHIFYPGHYWYRFPRWFRTYVDRPVSRFLDKIGVVGLLQRYQTFVLKYFWKRAAKKWPQVKEGILNDYEWMTKND